MSGIQDVIELLRAANPVDEDELPNASQSSHAQQLLTSILGLKEDRSGATRSWLRSHLPTLRIRRRYALAIGVVALVGAGAGAAAVLTQDSSNPLPPDSYVTNGIDRVPRQFSGQAPTDILNQLVDRAGGGLIADAQIGGAPADFQGTDSGKWAYFTVKAPSDGWAADTALWRTELISGALRDALHANGDYLAGSRASVLLPDGSKVQSSIGCCGNVTYNQQFDTPSIDKIRSDIEEAAKGTGLTIKSVDIVTADQPAPLVVATTGQDPAEVAAQIPSLGIQLFGKPPRYEGYYLEIRDSTSKDPIAILMTSFRIGSGTEWMRPALVCQHLRDPSACMAHLPNGASSGSARSNRRPQNVGTSFRRARAESFA